MFFLDVYSFIHFLLLVFVPADFRHRYLTVTVSPLDVNDTRNDASFMLLH